MEIVAATKEDGKWIIHHRIEMFRSMGWSNNELDATRAAMEGFFEDRWDGNPACYLAMEGNEVVGGCAVAFYADLPSSKNKAGKSAYIMNMYIEPEFRGRGIGTSLLNRILNECKTRGIGKVALHDTEMSRSIYEKHGFSKCKNCYELLLK
ncbi:MAG: GNAT family N-acetyltransferase [Candidatus Hodarchaeota archaeon]